MTSKRPQPEVFGVVHEILGKWTTCAMCGRLLRMRDAHVEEEDSWCRRCWRLKEREERDRLIQRGVAPCPTCGQAFNSKRGLNAHMVGAGHLPSRRRDTE